MGFEIIITFDSIFLFFIFHRLRSTYYRMRLNHHYNRIDYTKIINTLGTDRITNHNNRNRLLIQE